MHWSEWKIGYDLSLLTAARVKDVLRLLRPQSLVGAKKVRIGRHFDGGYVMLDRFEDIEAAYSLGINDDVSWDIDIARLGVPIHQYDHTIPGLPEQHPLFSWKPICISGHPSAENERSLEALIAENGHQLSNRLLLKCDIEGSEWALLQAMPNSVLRQFEQIVIEIHSMEYLLNDTDGNHARRSLLNLTHSHHVVHVHANNFAPCMIMGGYPIPNVLELTLMRKDAGQFVGSTETFPTALDMPCASDRADLFLGSFVFE